MGVHPFRNILIPTPSRVKPDSCEIFLYSGVKNGTVFQPQKQDHFFCFPAGIFKILRIPEESYTPLYFTKKTCSKTGKCNLGWEEQKYQWTLCHKRGAQLLITMSLSTMHFEMTFVASSNCSRVVAVVLRSRLISSLPHWSSCSAHHLYVDLYGQSHMCLICTSFLPYTSVCPKLLSTG